jgi:hypothetical protein
MPMTASEISECTSLLHSAHPALRAASADRPDGGSADIRHA